MQCLTSAIHFVLLDLAAGQVMDHSFGICFHGERVGAGSPLLAFEDMEVVVCRVAACVALCSQRGAEDDQVFGDGCVDDVHASHGATGIVEQPLFGK